MRTVSWRVERIARPVEDVRGRLERTILFSHRFPRSTFALSYYSDLRTPMDSNRLFVAAHFPFLLSSTLLA